MVTVEASALSRLGFSSHDDARVRVRVRKNLNVLEVSGLGLKITPGSAFFDVSPVSSMTSVKITRTRAGEWRWRWSALKKQEKIKSERLWIRGEMVRIGDEPVPYDLEVVLNKRGQMDVVAWLDLEEYLAGVLPSEMPVAWPEEALKAQAVAARSFVLRMAKDRQRRHFDVDSTVYDQVFKFLHEVDTRPEWRRKLNRVLRETRGELVLDQNGKVLKAFYSADCGCQTEDPRYVWGPSANFQSVKDPTCEKRKVQTWNLTLKRHDVRASLLEALKVGSQADLRALHVAGRTPSGRVAKVVAALDVQGKPDRREMNSQEFRRIIGFDKIRSTDFQMQWVGTDLKIRGRGVGHGVGLCQTGAKHLASEGLNYREILKFYYPRAQLYSPPSPTEAKRALNALRI